MNQYWLVAFVVFSGGLFFLGYEDGSSHQKAICEKQDERQEQNTIAAQRHVITQIGAQDKISKEETNAYQSSLTAISTLYTPVIVPEPISPASGSVRPVSVATPRAATSRKYHLTLEQCDQEEAKSNALWNWAQQQHAVK